MTDKPETVALPRFQLKAIGVTPVAHEAANETVVPAGRPLPDDEGRSAVIVQEPGVSVGVVFVAPQLSVLLAAFHW